MSLTLTLAASKKLQGESNFRTWKADIQLLLQANNLDDYIDKSLSQPIKCRDGDTTVEDTAGKTIQVDKKMVERFQAWKAGNASALKAIRDNIVDPITVSAIDSLDNAATLGSRYAPPSRARALCSKPSQLTTST